jgi:hypothetical protein
LDRLDRDSIRPVSESPGSLPDDIEALRAPVRSIVAERDAAIA